MHYTALSQTGENAAYNTTSLLPCQTIYATDNLSIHYILCIYPLSPHAQGALKRVFSVHYGCLSGCISCAQESLAPPLTCGYSRERRRTPKRTRGRAEAQPRLSSADCSNYSADVRRVRRGVGVSVAFKGASGAGVSGAGAAGASGADTAASPPARYLARHSEQ